MEERLSVIDSLELELEKEKDDIQRIKLLNKLFKVQYPTSYEKALNYANYAFTLATGLDNENEESKRLVSESSNNVGVGYLLLDQYEKSLKYLLIALENAEMINDTTKIATALYNTGLMYDFKGETAKGLEYVKQAAKLNELKGNLESAAISYSSIAADYFFADNYEEAMIYYDKAMTIAISTNKKKIIGNLHSNRAEALKNLKRYDEALELNQKSIALDVELNNKSGLETSYLNIAALYLEMGQNKRAIEFNKKSLEVALEFHSIANIMKAYDGLARVYKKSGNGSKALEYTELYANWKDSLYNQQNAEAIAEMQTKYDTEKKEAENDLLKAQQKLDKAEIDQQSFRQQMLLILLGGGLLAGGYISYSLVLKKKLLRILSKKNSIIEEKNKDITDSINYAQRIQNAILPATSILSKHFESFIYYRPKDIVSGDFYWVKEVGDHVFFSVIDCSGHGVPGAFMSIIGYSELNKIVDDLSVHSTGEILTRLNKQVNKALDMEVDKEQSLRDGMDISICCVNKKTNVMEYAGANNSIYLLKNKQHQLSSAKVVLENKDSIFYEIKPDKKNVGGGKNNRTYQTHTIQLHANDVIYLFSDGYPDQFGGPEGMKFMYGPFKDLLLSVQGKKMKDQLAIIDKTMIDWKGGREQLDDISVMGVKIG